MFNFIQKIAYRLTAFYGYLLFGKWGIHIKFGSRISGVQYIEIGEQFGARDHFWIAAIDNYLGVKYEPEIKIGKNVSLSDFCHIAAINKVDIGDDVLIGSHVHITDHSHGNYAVDAISDSPSSIPLLRGLHSAGPVKVGNNVWIGDGVVVLSNVTIGDGAVIGANSVVSRDIPANTIAAGAPARVIKFYENGRWVRNNNE